MTVVPKPPTSLADARRERTAGQRRRAAEAHRAEADLGQPYVPAEDVMKILNRVGECVRALPSFGRTRTQTTAVVAKRTLSAISTCSPDGLAEDDALRPILTRLSTTRGALRETTTLTGAQRIAAIRWLGQLADVDDPAWAEVAEHCGPPAFRYVIRDGAIVRELDEERGTELALESCEERIHDLALAGALIAAEIDRLQQRRQRRSA